ncbi:MAG: hypothetical protein Q4C85_06930 [Actinomyces sp.]|uniref:hypothetical protein n=1 Tax=Actinomyces sp. TaxID=29317 RepID=UPI0026DB9CA1|nr:hypothetical protein [Actinomyces sp.]MDO4243475.1 hypothetical protein [Actinomyces sp.]
MTRFVRTSLVIAVSVCALAASACSDSSESSATPSPSVPTVGTPDPTTVPTEVMTPASVDPTEQAQATQQVEQGDIAADQVESVPFGQAVALDDGLVVSAGTPTAAELSAGAGELGGPGVIVPVTVANSTGEELPLSGLVATVAYGPDQTPASEVLTASDPAPATLAAGEAIVLEMAFLVPAEGLDAMTVVVDPGAGSRAAVFTGSAA